jgi:hypothetical protein
VAGVRGQEPQGVVQHVPVLPQAVFQVEPAVDDLRCERRLGGGFVRRPRLGRGFEAGALAALSRAEAREWRAAAAQAAADGTYLWALGYYCAVGTKP